MTNFSTPRLAIGESGSHANGADSWVGPASGPALAGRALETSAPHRADGFFSGFDGTEPSSRDLGPGESHYELTFTLNDGRGDSGVDWAGPAANGLDAERPNTEEIEAVGPLERAPGPWYDHFLDSWGQRLFSIAAGCVAFAVLLIGALLMRSLIVGDGDGDGPTVATTRLSLVLASIGTIALLLVGLLAGFLSFLLADLARSLRRPRDPAIR